MHHPIAEGLSPVKQRTPLGGACTALAIAAITALSAFLITNYLHLTSIASQPVYVPVTMSYADVPSAPAALVAVSGIDLSHPLVSGLRVSVAAHGPRCNRITAWNASNFLTTTGSFSYALSFDNASGAAIHTFDCPTCAPMSVSVLEVLLDVTCQVRRYNLAPF